MSAEFSKLYRAIMSDDQTVYTELRHSNRDVLRETVKHSEDTLLHVAAYWKRRDIAEIIIDLRPSLLLENAKGETPLHAAASAGSEDVTRLIIDRCRQIEAAETGESIIRKKSKNEEDTALHKAVRNGHLEVVRLLIHEDPVLTKLVNKDGDSPLFMAVDTRQLDIADIILTVSDCSFKGRKNMNALHTAIAHRNSPHDTARGMVTSLIQNRERGGLVDQRDDKFGWTPLHYAADMNDTQTIQQLVSAEHLVASIKDNNGMTALHIAAKRGHIKAVKKLLEICPEICGIVDDKGQSFFHIAVKKRRIAVIRFALGSHQQLFADVFLNMQDNQGNTALHLAATKKDDFILFLMTSDRRLSRATSNSDGLNVSGSFRIHPFPPLFRYLDILFRVSKPGTMQLVKRPENKRPEEEVDKNRELREMNLLISTIIATVSFTAALSVPGGFKNNGPDEGTAALAQKRDFRWFFIFNAIAFGLSVTSIFIVRYNPKFKSQFDFLTELISHGATTAMLIAFLFGTSVVLGPSEAELATLVQCVLLGCLLLLYLLSILLVKIKSATESTDENDE